jgi:VWFA-related protein
MSSGSTGTAPTLKVQSNLVVLDVVVTDAKGNVVPGLQQQDFNVFQDGKPQAIRYFEPWTARTPLPDKPVLDRFGRADWGEAPLNIFVLDELNTPFEEIGYAAAMLKKYLLTQPALLGSPASLLVVTDRGYQTLTDYTRDRDLIITKLDKRPPAIPEQFGRGGDETSNNLTAQSFALLQQIALSTAGLHEHKNIVWIGRGFPGFDPTTLTSDSQDSLTQAIRATVTLLLDARVAVYKVDPMQTSTAIGEVDIAASLDVGGGQADAPIAGEDPFADNFNFNLFAQQTGGQYFYGLNDLNRYIGSSIDQGAHFYTLTYRPPSVPPDTKDGTYRNITLTMNKPGLTARTRQGYYVSTVPEPPPTTKQLGFALGEAAVGGMVYTGVSTHIAGVAPAKEPGKVSITFTVEDRTLQWKPDTSVNGEVAEFTAVLVALNAKHEVIDSAAYTMHPYLLAKDEEKLATGAMTVRDDVTINAKTTALRVLVRDGSGRIGTADVPAEQVQALVAALAAEHHGRH